MQDAGVLPVQTYFSALFFIIPGYLLLYSSFQLYMPRRIKSYRQELWDIIRANGIGLMAFILVPINEQIQNIAQKKDTLCRRMYN